MSFLPHLRSSHNSTGVYCKFEKTLSTLFRHISDILVSSDKIGDSARIGKRSLQLSSIKAKSVRSLSCPTKEPNIAVFMDDC